MKDLKVRFITAIVVAPIVVACFVSYESLVGLVASIVMLTSFELMSFSMKEEKKSYIAYLTALSTLYPIIYGLWMKRYPDVSLTAIFLTGAISIMLVRRNFTKTFVDYSAFFTSLLYISFGLSFFMPIYRERGGAIALLVLTSTWAFDSFAYFFGLSFGRHKIFRAYTNKSWEGVFGGFFGTILYVSIYSFISKILGFNHLGIAQVIVFSTIVSVMDTFGDVFESSLKRYFGVKDAGIIMPGHGGMLDRVDGLLFVTPVVYMYLHFFG